MRVCVPTEMITLFFSRLSDLKFQCLTQLPIWIDMLMLANFFSIEIRRKHVIIVVIAISICVLTIGLVLGLVDWRGVENDSPEIKPAEQAIGEGTKPPPSISVLGNYTRAAVATDGEPCAQIGV